MAVRGHSGAASTRGAFTLIELLVVIAVIALLISILLPALARSRSLARQARELAAAQQLITAFTLYADDSRGHVMPGYPTAALVSGPLIVLNEAGQRMFGPEAQRYPWRIAPFLDYNFRGLYKDEKILTQLRENPPIGGVDWRYFVSLYPTLGLNAIFVGGSDASGHPGTAPAAISLYGKYFLTRIEEPRHPSRLLAFVSGRDEPLATLSHIGPPGGRFTVEPPYLTERRWEASYNANSPPKANSGYVALRYDGRAIAAALDGHAESLGWDDLQDMTRWADGATGKDWVLQPH